MYVAVETTILSYELSIAYKNTKIDSLFDEILKKESFKLSFTSFVSLAMILKLSHSFILRIVFTKTGLSFDLKSSKRSKTFFEQKNYYFLKNLKKKNSDNKLYHAVFFIINLLTFVVD